MIFLKLEPTNLVCKKGIKTMLESEMLILAKNYVFVKKGILCDGIFKLGINKITICSYIVDCSSLWHDPSAYLNINL